MIEDGSLDTVDILDSLKDAVVLTNADRSVVSKGPDLIRSAVQRVGVLKGMLLKDKTLDNKWIPSYVEELLEDLQDFNKIRGTRQLSGMGTTLDGVYLSNDRAYIAHVGDGRVYKISTDGYIRQLTNDHISECTLPPQISSLEKTIRTERNGLISYIGSGSDLLVDIFSIPFRSGETILMLTDGFTKAIAEPELVNAAGNWTHFEKRIMDLYTNPEWMSKVYGRVYDISQTEAQKTLSEKDHATIIAIRRND